MRRGTFLAGDHHLDDVAVAMYSFVLTTAGGSLRRRDWAGAVATVLTAYPHGNAPAADSLAHLRRRRLALRASATHSPSTRCPPRAPAGARGLKPPGCRKLARTATGSEGIGGVRQRPPPCGRGS